MDIEPLRKLGLTEAEIKVYLTLLDTGRAPIALISQKTKLNRTALYDVMENLVEKGLASYVYEEKKKYFKAAKPPRLLEYLASRQQQLEEQEGSLKSLVGQLSKITPFKEEQLKVEIFRGKKGIKTVLEDLFEHCKKGDEVLVFGFGASHFLDVLGHYYHHYIFRTVKAGLKFRFIFDEEEAEQPYYKKLGKVPLTKVKIAFKDYEAIAHTRIYGDKVAIILVEKDPTAILIHDKKVAQGYRYFFEFLWGKT